MKTNAYKIGLDVGSTTVKTAVLDADNNLLCSSYERHYSDIKQTISKVLGDVLKNYKDFTISATGSGGLAVSKWLGIPFIQEVVAGVEAIKHYIPTTDVAIELGGEDAKITYFKPGLEQRMNGICAGGTGAFIDQTASLLNTDAKGLNELAKEYKTIYPIASRCGVFAKTDIQALLNDGATKADIAASIFQSVVNQTISGLACGKTIRGNIALLGGPMHFLPQLRERYIKTLNPTSVLIPENSQVFNALGAAISSDGQAVFSADALLKKLKDIGTKSEREVERLPQLFESESAKRDFFTRHEKAAAERADIGQHKGATYLGIDAGSTTTKVILINDKKQILYTFYDSNEGNPLESVLGAIKEIYKHLPKDAYIAHSTVTGYGEYLIKAALLLDEGVVETIAHQTASEHFLPGVEFIVDIGGQDMKALKIKNGIINDILLNEACSSGCGSFIETFAKALGLGAKEFAEKGLTAAEPVSLGTRCTVFMNSSVKQAQKEGASVGDISAGLAYSVVKNALFKVIKLRDVSALGDKIIVQGGTFLNNSVLRAFEILTGKNAVRPDIAGLMGAYGCALLSLEKAQQKIGQEAQQETTKQEPHQDIQPQQKAGQGERNKSTIITLQALNNFKIAKSSVHCKKCPNTCLLTISTFADGRKFITNNKCEEGLFASAVTEQISESNIVGDINSESASISANNKTLKPLNLYAQKNSRLFENYKPLTEQTAKANKQTYRGKIGVPRVLNLYENYPFWHTFLTSLGFEVILSPESDRDLYTLGMETMPSESVCYPAKIVHGHIEWLIAKGVKTIFYPCIPYEIEEDKTADNHYNCPIVATYPEVIRMNMDEALKANGVALFSAFLPYDCEKRLLKRLVQEFSAIDKKTDLTALFNTADFPHINLFSKITKSEIKKAIKAAYKEDSKFKRDIQKMGEDALAHIEKTNSHGIVLAGRPYHIDKEINHGIPEMLNSFGFTVLTEDSIAHLAAVKRPIRVFDQWMYHTRLYRAAEVVRVRDNLEILQLNSFGCGLDAVTTDKVQEMLEEVGKIYTTLKIDEISNLGAAKIRVRSLMAVLKERKNKGIGIKPIPPKKADVVFTKAMRPEYTILSPQLSPMHFTFVESAIRMHGYNMVVMEDSVSTIDTGLKYVNNDACYPAIITLGSLIDALKSGKYDTHKTAVIIQHTGGGCRASNYRSKLQLALKQANLGHVPILSLSISGSQSHPGFKLTTKILRDMVLSGIYGDLLMRLVFKTRPYEKVPGTTTAMYEKWTALIKADLEKGKARSKRAVGYYAKRIVADFLTIPVLDIKKPRVGVVGEILVKYHPLSNNYLTDILEAEGCEPVVLDFIDFFLYTFYSDIVRYNLLSGSRRKKMTASFLIWYMERLRKPVVKALKGTKFGYPVSIYKMAKIGEEIVSTGNISGEGWFLTAEMVDLIKLGVNNIVCTQPFACLPNHVTGKGSLKAIKQKYPQSNIVAVDYDPGASEVNQLNRIKLMLSVAFKDLEKEQAGEQAGVKQNATEPTGQAGALASATTDTSDTTDTNKIKDIETILEKAKQTDAEFADETQPKSS